MKNSTPLPLRWLALAGILFVFLFSATSSHGQIFCQASFSWSSNPNGQISFQNTSVGNYSSSQISFGDGTSGSLFGSTNHLYPGPGLYLACLTIFDSSGFCQSTFCDSVSIGGGTTCNAQFSFYDSSGTYYFFPDVVIAGSNYYWSFGDGTTSSQPYPVHTYTGAGPWLVCLTVVDSAQGCTNTYCDTLVLPPNCQASFGYQFTSAQNLLFNGSNIGQGSVSNYSWDFGDGSTGFGAWANHTYASAGFYTICLTITTTTGCTSTYCNTIFIQASGPCNAGFSYVDSSGYLFLLADVYNTSWTYSWVLSNGSTYSGPYPAFPYNSTGPLQICLTVTDSSQACTQTHCDTINPATTACVASFSYQQNNGIVYFYGASNTSGVYYYWNFGDGNSSTQQFPVHAYSAPGVYPVCLLVTSPSGCADTMCQTIIVQSVGPNCQAAFTWNVSPPLTLNFTNQSSGQMGLTSYQWSFGDGSTSTLINPVHTYTQAGVYLVCLTVSDFINCTSTYCDTIWVGNTGGNCSAQFSWSQNNQAVQFASTGSPTLNYQWSFGDGTSSTQINPLHTYLPGTYLVCLTVSDSSGACNDTYCDSITVLSNGQNCQAGFSYQVDSTNGVYFNNTSVGSYNNVVWYFGDGNTSTQLNPYHVYSQPGIYLVCLTIYNNNPANSCQSSYCDTIVVNSPAPPCIPQFYSIPDSSVFGNGVVYFGINNPCPGWTYSWNFGDSSTIANGTYPIHQFPDSGWYVVCVTAVDQNGNVLSWCDSIYAFRIGITGIAENGTELPFTLYPNPSAGEVNLEFTLDQVSQVSIRIFSLDGRLLDERSYADQVGVLRYQIEGETLVSGTYLVQLRAGEMTGNKRLVITR